MSRAVWVALTASQVTIHCPVWSTGTENTNTQSDCPLTSNTSVTNKHNEEKNWNVLSTVSSPWRLYVTEMKSDRSLQFHFSTATHNRSVYLEGSQALLTFQFQLTQLSIYWLLREWQIVSYVKWLTTSFTYIHICILHIKPHHWTSLDDWMPYLVRL